MKLDATDLSYPTRQTGGDGVKNHEVVPTVLITKISGLRNGGVNKLIGSLAKRNLVSKVQNSKYDGYRLTYGGYDYLAMRALSKRDSMYSVGNQIGVGKESDIYIVADAEGREMVLKLHRLGRVSFRAIKEKRDYLGKLPRPIDQARHCILMEFIDAYPLRQISDVPSPGKLYSTLMDIIVRFAHAGLIHGDFNEFNILIRRDSGEPVVIDFPQMVSTSHENAEWYFNRDVECIRTFFKRRFQYESALYPKFRRTLEDPDAKGEGFKLDVMVEASGFGRKDMKVLEEYLEVVAKEDDEEHSDEEEGEEDTESGEISESQSLSADEATAEVPKVDNTQKEIGTCAEGEPNKLDRVSEATDAQVSRSPPQSRSVSPTTLEKMRKLNLSGIKDIVSSDLSKTRARQQRKYHSKRSVRQGGRVAGSKAKQDTRVKVDKSGVWE
ncbi:RIO1 family-domain-containing protein [Infundibulicybe gibba]|nr:RIO1 family-domain-containing protein [Infundibulicybe gibba]